MEKIHSQNSFRESLKEIKMSSQLESIRGYLKKYKYLYPNIESWVDKVIHESLYFPQSKYIWTFNDADTIKCCCIFDVSERKLCHFSVQEPFRELGLGNAMLDLLFKRIPSHIYEIWGHGRLEILEDFAKFSGAEIIRKYTDYGDYEFTLKRKELSK